MFQGRMQLLHDVPASRHARLRCFLVPPHAADIPTGGLLEMELHLVVIMCPPGGGCTCLPNKAEETPNIEGSSY